MSTGLLGKLGLRDVLRLAIRLLAALTAEEAEHELVRVLERRMSPEARLKSAEFAEAYAAAIRAGDLRAAAHALGQAIGEFKG